ncbi:MAG: hydroxymethylbilane synthase [Lachnospiraceae bacterium]|nr:hydroxymethylbilane synthase [Lachnospiraceae bacterium]
MKIVIGTRASMLAVAQSEQVKAYIKDKNPQAEVSLLKLTTTGDQILDRRLDEVGGKGLFVRELDQALLDGRTDLSVHSLKDLPMETSEELPLLSYSTREDARDVLVLPKGVKDLDLSKPVGTSSMRRIVQLKELYPEATYANARGNLQTRLDKLDSGEYSALVLAAAGLKRLGLEERISRYFEPEEIIPAAGQGIIAVQGHKDKDYSYVAGFHDVDSEITGDCERAFVKELDGGCSSPIAAYARIVNEEVYLLGMYCNEDGTDVRRGAMAGKIADAIYIAVKLAKELKGE